MLTQEHADTLNSVLSNYLHEYCCLFVSLFMTHNSFLILFQVGKKLVKFTLNKCGLFVIVHNKNTIAQGKHKSTIETFKHSINIRAHNGTQQTSPSVPVQYYLPRTAPPGPSCGPGWTSVTCPSAPCRPGSYPTPPVTCTQQTIVRP